MIEKDVMVEESKQNGAVTEVRGVRKTYESEGAPVRALRGVDLTIGTGEFVAIMGPSGCGKSTLLNLIAGLDTPTDGEIVVAGEPLQGKDENALARMRRAHIGIVFQFFNLLEGMSVLENVTLPAIIAGPRASRPSHGRETCSTCSAWRTRRRTPPACSRAVSASASPSRGPSPTNPPWCWPTSRPGHSTPPAARRSSSCSVACTPSGQAIMLVTHDQSVADAASRLVRMRDGRIENGA